MRLALLFLAFSGILMACTGSNETLTLVAQPAAPAKVLRYDIYAPFYSLTPGAVGGSGLILPFIYSYLFIPNENFELEPDLATEWEYDEITRSWRIRIRDGVFFHDGAPLTATDVKSSLETALKQDNPSAFGNIDRIDCLDRTTLRIFLKSNDRDFLRALWCLEIMPASSRGDEQPVGSGPFRFSYKRGDKEVGLVANDRYYRGRPALDKVIFTFEPDTHRSWARLLSGETDLAINLSPLDFAMMGPYEDRFWFNKEVEGFRTVLLFNSADPLFTDPCVRLAIAYAINKDYIVRTILGGMGIVASGSMGYHSPYRNPESEPIPYDPQKALHLLEEAGWTLNPEDHYLYRDGKLFEFTILFERELHLHQRVAQYLRLCLSDIGIKVHLEAQSKDCLTRRHVRNDAFQAVISNFSEIYKADTAALFWCGLGGECAVAGGFNAPEVSRAVASILQEADRAKKRQLMIELDSLLTSLQPAVFLYQKASLNVLSKRFHSTAFESSSLMWHLHARDISPAGK